ncbi:MAG: PLDc N-terminal domain-containing protein [Clostridia bacterium]|nr:PLDc N-terminal domain-containing protein [Clostridia bacterium]
MKLLKMLFSKMLITFLALLVQLAIIVLTVLFFNKYFFTFRIFELILGLLIFLNIINKNESPEFKLPWLVILLTLPLFGVAVYVMFANSKMPMKQFRRMVDAACLCNSFMKLTPKSNGEICAFLKDYTGIEKYLRKASFSRGYLHNKTKYFPSGEEFYADLLTELEKA